MTARRIQIIGWGLFLIYYFAAKYFVAGFTGFSVGYLVSVLILVTLTAIIPFYTARWLAGKLTGAARVAAILLLPVLLTMAGLSVFFVTFIAPNFEAIKLPDIIHRAFEPGIAITVLLLVPLIAGRISPEAPEAPDASE